MKHSRLTLSLVAWAAQHWPDPIDAMNATNPEYEWKCVGAIFRRVAQNDPKWFWRVVDEIPEQMLALSPYISSIDIDGATFPPPIGWRAWLDALELASGKWWLADECEASRPPERVQVPERVQNRRESGSGLFGRVA